MLVDFSDVNSAGIYYKNLTLVSYITRPLSAVYSQRDDITVTPMLMTPQLYAVRGGCRTRRIRVTTRSRRPPS